jgi:hypothetical protein
MESDFEVFSKRRVFIIHSERSGYPMESLKKAFYRIAKKKKNAKGPGAKSHGNCAFTLHEEAMVIGYLQMRSYLGSADRIQGILSFSAVLRNGTPVSLTAAKNLLLKYKDLFRKTKERSMMKAQTDPVNIANTEAFVKMWKRYQQHMVFPLDHIVNGDETLLRAVKDGSEVVRLESRFKRDGSEVLCDSSSIGSMTPFVSASGTLWLLVFCLKIPPRKASSQDKLIELYIPLEERQRRSTNSAHGILIFGNSTGLLNSCLWDKSLEKLSQIIKASSATPLKEVALFTDNLSIHRQHQSIAKAMRNGVYQLYFPPNCSHWIQPLDDLLFASLQMTIRALCQQRFTEDGFWAHKKSSLKELVLEACMESVEKNFTQKKIQKSFQNVGLHPFDEALIIQRAWENVGTQMEAVQDVCPSVEKASSNLVNECKDIFVQLAGVHEKKISERKRRGRRLSISTKYASEGTDAITILDAEAATQSEERIKKAEKAMRKVEKMKEKEEKQQKNEEKRRVREAESCKMEDCKRRWKNKSSNDEKWLWCSYCDSYGICWKCGEMKSSKNSVRAHERKCRRK